MPRRTIKLELGVCLPCSSIIQPTSVQFSFSILSPIIFSNLQSQSTNAIASTSTLRLSSRIRGYSSHSSPQQGALNTLKACPSPLFVIVYKCIAAGLSPPCRFLGMQNPASYTQINLIFTHPLSPPTLSPLSSSVPPSHKESQIFCTLGDQETSFCAHQNELDFPPPATDPTHPTIGRLLRGDALGDVVPQSDSLSIVTVTGVLAASQSTSLGHYRFYVHHSLG